MKNLFTALLMTIVTTVLFGLLYPLLFTGVAQLIFPDRANGQLIRRPDGTVAGSRLIGQPFVSAGYFYSRPVETKEEREKVKEEVYRVGL